jgi:hypothetical protein
MTVGFHTSTMHTQTAGTRGPQLSWRGTGTMHAAAAAALGSNMSTWSLTSTMLTWRLSWRRHTQVSTP